MLGVRGAEQLKVGGDEIAGPERLPGLVKERESAGGGIGRALVERQQSGGLEREDRVLREGGLVVVDGALGVVEAAQR